MASQITPNPNVVGDRGPTGPTGSTGATGATGPTGASLVIPSLYIKNTSSAVSRGLPGVQLSTETASQSLGVNTVQYNPIFVTKSIVITDVTVYLNAVSSTSGATARFALYNADNDWMPTTLHTDFGTVAVTGSAGNRTISSLSVTVTPGAYLLRLQGDASASRPTVLTRRGYPINGSTVGDGTQFVYRIYDTGHTYAAAEDPASPKPGIDGTSATPFLNWMNIQWTQA
jgi:hypothetical protein